MIHSFRTKFLAIALLIMPLTITSCDDTSDVVKNILEFLLSMMGWNPSSENTDDQEKGDVYDDDDNETLPSSVDLSQYFPPVGNQGSYGTCVAWSTGYALKTALDAKSNSYSSSQLSSSSYQCSPIDLWHNIPTGSKTSGCNGSNFEPALQSMMDNGVASLSNVPFTNSTMVCDNVSGVGNSGNKLSGYRIIAYTKDLQTSGAPYGMTVANFKHYLAAGYPILIGARLGENFMGWNNSGILTSDTEDYNGQHAYHALVVTGYDDSKSAFRIRNSWGKDDWGDDGCIWIDYNFFINQFVFGAWIAYNSDQKPTSSSAYQVSLKRASPNDLCAHVYSDVLNSDGTRTLFYDVENSGSSSISSSDNWSVVYMLYNAKNLNEKVVLFQDFYGNKSSNDFGYGCSAVENSATSVNVSPGEKVSTALGGKRMSFTYSLPTSINNEILMGNYYLVLVVNPFNSFSENNFKNNYCFVSAYNSKPLTISAGKITNMPSSLNDLRTLYNSSNKNTYSGDELVSMLLHQKNNQSLKRVSVSLKSTKKMKSIVK